MDVRACSSLVNRYATPQSGQRFLCRSDLSQPCRGDRKVAFRAAAAFRCRLADDGTDQSLLLEALERVVDARENDRLARALLDGTRDRHAVRLLAFAHQGEKHEQ